MRTIQAAHAHDTGLSTRLFPLPGARAGVARGQNEESARRLLHFVDRRFTFAQRVFGWNLDPETRLGRVLLLRRQAFEAERAGAARMADSLWGEAHRALKHAAADPAVWRRALDISAFSEAVTPEVLRARFIRELFIDLHRSLFDSLRAAPPSPDPSDRLFVHCTYAEWLVDLAGFDRAMSATILRPMFDPWLAACRRAGKWNRAVRICTRLAARFTPDGTYLDELVLCLLRMTIDRLTRPPRPFTGRDARYLRVGIRSIERVCDEHGPTSLVLAALARLHAMHAVALANVGDCAESLVAISIALDYSGDDGQFRGTQDRLMAAMNVMLRKVEARRTSGAETRDAGDAAVEAQASKGFGPMAQYRLSERASRIREMRSAAEAIDLWRRLGLPRPGAGWPSRAQALVTALAAVLRERPCSSETIARAWDAAVARHELARDVPREPVEAFLERRLL